MVVPRRGEIWWVNFDPIEGHEQAGRRPALVVSATRFNQGPAQLAVVLPMTTTRRAYALHVWVEPEESGLRQAGAVMCDQIRTVSLSRLLDQQPAGHISPAVMSLVEDRLRALLTLPTT